MTVSVMENFQMGLYVTVWGMALVFLTLLIVMVVIWALDRVFKAKAEESGQGALSVLPMATAVFGAPPKVGEVKMDLSDEAAAVAVAIELQKRQGAGATRGEGDCAQEREIFGETVSVVAIDAGPGTWKSYGRLKAMQ